MLRHKNFNGQEVHIGPGHAAGFVDCTLRKCHIQVHGFSTIWRSLLVDCTVEYVGLARGPRRAPNFLGSDFLNCAFVGAFEDVSWGSDPHDVVEPGKPSGQVIGCDFTRARLMLCSFYSVDVEQQSFAPWPQFVIPQDRLLLAALSSARWPGRLGVLINRANTQPARLRAIAGTAAGFFRRYGVGVRALGQALDELGEVHR